MEQTTRQRIAERIREEPLSATAIAEEFALSTTATLEHLQHVAESLSGSDEQLLVAPPECRDCGFNDFDERLNLPSRCPECNGEGVAPPFVRID